MLGILLTTDPMKIIYNASDNVVANYDGLYLSGIVMTLRAAGIFACLITITWGLIKLLYVDSPQQQQEEKSEISHRVVILILLGSCFFLWNLVKDVLDTFFY